MSWSKLQLTVKWKGALEKFDSRSRWRKKHACQSKLAPSWLASVCLISAEIITPPEASVTRYLTMMPPVEEEKMNHPRGDNERLRV